MSKRRNESDAKCKAKKRANKEKKEKKVKEIKEEKKEKPPKRMKQNPTLSLSLDRIATTTLHKPTNEPLLMLEFVFGHPLRKTNPTSTPGCWLHKPSPIQARAWPVALAGKVLIAVAKTES